MGRVTNIPDNLLPELLKLAGDGATPDQLLDYLKAKGIKSSKSALWRRLKGQRKERAEVARAVLSDKLKSSVTADLDVMSELQQGLLDRVRELNKPELLMETIGPVTPAMMVLKNLSAELRTVTEKKLELSGASPDIPSGGVRVWLPPESDDT